MIPLQAWGRSCMSIVDFWSKRRETPRSWRGPCDGCAGEIDGQVEWGALDILVVDMPTGTGDARDHGQRVALTGR